MPTLLTRITAPRTLRQIRHLTPVPPGTAPPRVDRVYREVERDFGILAPPVALHAASPDCLAGAWLLLRAALLAAGRVPRADKEYVAAVLSQANSCPYCVDVHATAAATLGPGPAASLRAVAEWSRGAAGGYPPPGAAQAAEMTAVVLTFHHLNRMVNVFLDGPLLPPARLARRVARLVAGPLARRRVRAGDTAAHLPPAALPPDLRWAAAAPAVADAVARAAAAFDQAGTRAVPAPVRAVVGAFLADWDGAPPPLSRTWLTEALAPLADGDRPAGALALLTAVASYRVDQDTVAAYRRHCPGDAALVDVTSWASFTAARTLAARLRRPCPG